MTRCRLNERVQTTEAWEAEHRPHLPVCTCRTLRKHEHPPHGGMDSGGCAVHGGSPLREVQTDFICEDAGHPSGDWVRLCCPCGARHTTIKPPAAKG